VGHTLKPAELGEEVFVLGDGWGGGEGCYPATVTEADDFTFTVIATESAPTPWMQAHVLRRHCVPRGASGKGQAATAPAAAGSSHAKVVEAPAREAVKFGAAGG